MFRPGTLDTVLPIRTTLLALLTVTAVATTQSVRASSTVTPADVYVRVAHVHDVLEQIRFEMGRPRNQQPDIGVSNAAPREVFFQALTLFQKADRLCFEQTRDHAEAPKTPDGDIAPSDVLSVVDAAFERLDRVRKDIGMPDTPHRVAEETAKTPTDVFRSTVQANRQLNLLLDHRTTPSDVFQQVTLAISYASRLLARYPGAERIPDAPTFESGKRPADVYQRLLACFGHVSSVGEQCGLKMLELEVKNTRGESVTPDDVYDIASLLVSELMYLHSCVPRAEPPVPSYDPGRKFPAHVYQRAGILEKQLQTLEALAATSPAILTGKE